MSSTTVRMNRVIANNNININKKAGLLERFKKYLLDNSAYFAASASMMSGNAYGSVQIMKNTRN